MGSDPIFSIIGRPWKTPPKPASTENPREIIAQNDAAIAVFDSYPVSSGHALVLPRRHVETIWDLEPAEYDLCFRLVRDLYPILSARFAPDGFNVGANCGEAACAT